MAEEGHPINRKRVQRSMREMGIQGITPGPYLSKCLSEHRVYPYLLRNRSAQRANEIWGCDITYIFTERLWRSVKYEEVYLSDYANPREARGGLARYFSFYNTERPHQALDYRRPAALYFSERAGR